MLSHCLLAVLAASMRPMPANSTWQIDAAKPLHVVSPSLYGIFFEEINCAGDGGIYAELVRNRGFEDAETPAHWRVSGGEAKLVKSDALSNASPTSLAVTSNGATSIENEGYWGMAVRTGETYNLSFFTRGDANQIRTELVDEAGKPIGGIEFRTPVGGWKQSFAKFTATETSEKAKLRLTFKLRGTTQIDMVSLFPEKTWRNRANGMRPDLMQMLADLKPAFMRFPGGCWVEGDTMALAQRWKQTVGDAKDRRTQPNIWRYMSTNGQGYHEYLQMCEDLGADALFVINCGMSHREVVPMGKMDEFVQDAIDAVEYALGPATSKWGALRARNGHPKAFPLKYLQIGNENGGPAYEERYGLIYRALKAKYPKLNLIANLWGGRPQKTPVDILDEHYYSNPEFFIANSDRYDKYDRNGPKIYVGEYAVTQDNGTGSLRGALAEAAFMTGMERNSDVVVMSSYAPLFANVHNKAWNPDLIYFDSSRTIATPSYHVQRMFANNRAHRVFGSYLTQPVAQKRVFPPGGIGLGTWNTQAEFKDIRVTEGGKVLFSSPDGSGFQREAGNWAVRDGLLSQTSNAQHSRTNAGAREWKNYTLQLKARKVSGAEGFLITVGRRDDRNYIWWNLGGWGNTLHGVEMATDGGKVVLSQNPGRIESDRWYDLKVEYTDERIRGYIDGKLVLNQSLPETKSLHGVAGINEKGDTVILKLVNVSDSAHSVTIDLAGSGWQRVVGLIETLSGNNRDENDFDDPRRVAPRSSALSACPAKFDYQIPPRTLAILKVKKA